MQVDRQARGGTIFLSVGPVGGIVVTPDSSTNSGAMIGTAVSLTSLALEVEPSEGANDDGVSDAIGRITVRCRKVTVPFRCR